MRMRNTRSMKAAGVAVAAGALFTAAPFVASQSAGAVEQGMAAAPWRIGFADVVQKVRPEVFSISVKVVEETHGRGGSALSRCKLTMAPIPVGRISLL
jgi:hypothetical protein